MDYCQDRPQDASRRPFGQLKGGQPRHSTLRGNGWADDEAPARCCAPGLSLWRRWGDSNSRGASTPTSLAGRRTRPLCDISIAFPRLHRGTHGQPTGRMPREQTAEDTVQAPRHEATRVPAARVPRSRYFQPETSGSLTRALVPCGTIMVLEACHEATRAC